MKVSFLFCPRIVWRERADDEGALSERRVYEFEGEKVEGKEVEGEEVEGEEAETQEGAGEKSEGDEGDGEYCEGTEGLLEGEVVLGSTTTS